MLKHSKASFVVVLKLQQCTRYYLLSQLKIEKGVLLSWLFSLHVLSCYSVQIRRD